ncbi:MAG: hypothetical protein Q8S00_07370 [Deltaproteobacteria bacterium]|nr:hypothetical protein [Deltaproteobacteria bacterium]MDZ4346027.1 hypothetical protein [Candidatus Binatia bacterium]
MERTDLGTVMQEAIAKFDKNRIGDKPRVFVTLSPDLAQVPWKNRTLEDFVRTFLYETLLTSDPEAAIEVCLRRRFALDDLSAFLGFYPTYWLQLRVSGRGLRILEPMIEELFAAVGYRREEWVGVEATSARLGVFGAIDAPTQRMIFCLESSRHVFKCDLLLPVIDGSAIPTLVARPDNRKAAGL